MMHFYSKTRKIKYFLDPPQKKKKEERLRDTNDRDMATHKFLSIPDGRDLDIYLVGIE